MSMQRMHRLLVALQILVALLTLVAVGFVIRAQFPPPGLVVQELHVHADGRVFWSRTVGRQHTATWSAFVRAPGREAPICANSDWAQYEEGTRTFEWTIHDFVGPSCPATLEPGWIVSVEWVPFGNDLAPTRHVALVDDCACRPEDGEPR